MTIGKPISSQTILYFQVHNQPAIFPDLVQSIIFCNQFFIDNAVSSFGFLESFNKVLGSAGTVAVLVCFSERL